MDHIDEKEPGYATAYRAVREGEVVTLHAEGETPSAGYRVWLEGTMLDVYPPEYVLYWQPPEGFAADMMTPFSVETRFAAPEPVAHVVVYDADGPHEVPVG